MATVANFIDATLQAAATRTVNLPTAAIQLTPSAPLFKVGVDGSITPASITFTATLTDLDAPVTLNIAGGTSSNPTAKSISLAAADMPGSSAVVIASATLNGKTYTASYTISKVQDGSIGATTYTWVKYADSAAGAGLSDDPSGKAYIGLAYNKSTPTESTTPGDYAWSLIKGTDGQPGAKGADGVQLYTWIKYSDNADGTGLYDVPTASTLYIGLAVNKTTATESAVKTDYVWSKFRGDQGVPGNAGGQGPRGPGHFYVAGSSWSDVVAEMATPGSSVVDDVVTISNGTTFTLEKRWDGSAWVATGVVIPGDLLVEGSVKASKLDTRGLAVRDLQGNIILGAGTGLPAAYLPAGVQNSEIPLGGNLLYNADFSNGLDRWTKNADGNSCNYDVSTAAAPKMAGLDWTLNRGVGEGTNTLQVNQPNTNQGTYFELFGDPIPVKSGSKYFLTAYTGAHRCAVNVFFYVYNVAGQIIGNWGAGSDLNLEEKPGGQRLSDFKRQVASGVAGSADSTEAYVRVVLRKEPTRTGFNYSDSWMMVCRVQVEEVVATATSPSPWKSPGISAAAYGGINTALALANAISNDGILDRSEKAQLRTEWAQEDSVWTQMRQSAIALGLDVSGYDQAHKATSDYLISMVPGWADTSQDTAISRTEFVTKFQNMYNARAVLDAAIKAKAATAPLVDVSNIVKKAYFDDGNKGGWGNVSGAETAITGTNSAAVPAKSQLVTNVRDCLEGGNTFSVTPGETLYYSGWLNTESTPYVGRIGMFVFNKAGQVIQYAWASLAPGTMWTYMQGSTLIPDGAVSAIPCLQQEGGDFAGKGYLRAVGMWIGRHARGATVGATIGQNLGGQFTKDNISTFIQAAAIGLALIDKASIGNLEALSAVMGRLRLGDGGYIAQGGFDGSWAWPPVGQSGFLFHPNGILFGNANDPNKSYFQLDIASSGVYMPGFSYSGRQLTLDSPIIVRPRLQTTLSVSIPVTPLRNVGGSSITFNVGCTISGGVGGPYRYLWTFAARDGASPIAMVGDPGAASAALRATGSGWKYGYLTVTVYDAGGAVATASADVSVQFGNAVEP